jgi:hypothetical protein
MDSHKTRAQKHSQARRPHKALVLRLTPEMYKAMERTAKKRGAFSVTEFIRGLIADATSAS